MGLQLWNGGQAAPVAVELPTDTATRHGTIHHQSTQGTPSRASRFNQRYWTDQTAKPEGIASRFWNWMTGSHTKEPPHRSLKTEANQSSEGVCSELAPGCTYDATYTFLAEGFVNDPRTVQLAINILTKQNSDETTKQCIVSKLIHDCNPPPTKCYFGIDYPPPKTPLGLPTSGTVNYLKSRCSTSDPATDIYLPVNCGMLRTEYNSRNAVEIPCYSLTPSLSLQVKVTWSGLIGACTDFLDIATPSCLDTIQWNMKNTILPKISSCFDQFAPKYPKDESCYDFLSSPSAAIPSPVQLPSLPVAPPEQPDQSFSMRSSLEFISPTFPTTLESAWKIHIWFTKNVTSQRVYYSQQRILWFLRENLGYMQTGSSRQCHYLSHEINPDLLIQTCGVEGKDDQLELSVPFSCSDRRRKDTKEKLSCFALSENLYLENEVIEGALTGVWSNHTRLDCKQTIEQATRDIIIPLIRSQYNTTEGYPKMIQCPVQPISDHHADEPWYKTAWIGLPVVLSVGALWISVVLIKNCRTKKEEDPGIKIIPKTDKTYEIV